MIRNLDIDKNRIENAKACGSLIATPRLVMLPIAVEDASQAFKWLSDSQVAKYMRYLPFTDVAREEEWLAQLASDKRGCELAVFLEDGTLIGSVGLSQQDGWELGYHFARDYWNCGYCTEAVRGLLAWAAYHLGVRCVKACYASQNVASGAVLKKCGFADDGVGEFSKVDGSESFISKRVKRMLPTVHRMTLNSKPFAAMDAGYKTIELRLNDAKLRAVDVGDLIAFACGDRTMLSYVVQRHEFDSFNELYGALDLHKCGYLPLELQFASPSDMDAYYSVEQQREYGVVGFELEHIARIG